MTYRGALIKALTPGYIPEPVTRTPEIARRPQTLSIEDEEEIMRRFARGERTAKIAEDYKVSRSCINYHLDRVRIRERKKRKSGQ